MKPYPSAQFFAPNTPVGVKVADWLVSLPNINWANPVQATIDGVTYDGAIFENGPDSTSVIYLLGFKPDCYRPMDRHGNVPIVFRVNEDEEDWYVATSYTPHQWEQTIRYFMQRATDLQPFGISEEAAHKKREEINPFGPSFQLRKWSHSTPIDSDYYVNEEKAEYKRLPVELMTIDE